MLLLLINFVAPAPQPSGGFDLGVACSETDVAARVSPPAIHKWRRVNSAGFSMCLNYFCSPPSYLLFLLLLDLQIIKASTTALEGTTTSSLRDPRLRRLRRRLISHSCPPQAPQELPSELWTTPCRDTTPPARRSASPISCPTIRGSLPARNLASRGRCTAASPPRCSARAHPLPHCRSTAADTTTTCPTRPRK